MLSLHLNFFISDGKRDSVKSTERSSQEEDARRSRSLDGEAILEPIRQMDKVRGGFFLLLCVLPLFFHCWM